MLLFVLENSPVRGNDDIVHGGYYNDGDDGDNGNERWWW